MCVINMCGIACNEGGAAGERFNADVAVVQDTDDSGVLLQLSSCRRPVDR